MDDSITTNTDTPDSSKKLKKITAVLIAVGVVSALCLIFFFCTIFNFKSSDSSPEILDAKQIGATDSSLLISWSCSGTADKYIVRCIDSNGNTYDDITAEIPFAAVRNLNPNNEYSVEISAVKDGNEYTAAPISCATEPCCEITAVSVHEVTQNSVTFSWEYSGADKGFVAVAYVLDTNGKRHLTSAKAEISEGSAPQCTISGLIPEMNYTVTVMPSTRYCKAGKANFTTGKYNNSYSALNIIRFVICPNDSDNSPEVRSLKSVEPNSPYKTSLIISGGDSKANKSAMALYIKDSSGNLVSETQYADVDTNPENKASFIHRIILLSFVSPESDGEYTAYLTIDGETAKKIKFNVKSEQ